MEKFLLAGKIVNTHSLHGQVRVYPLCDSAYFLCEFDMFYIDGKPTAVESARVHKNQALIKFEGVNSIDEAQALVGRELYIDRDDIELEEGRYFIEDIIGLSVRDAETGRDYGRVVNVIETGANDVFELRSPDGKTLLVPKIDDVVKKIDIEGGIIEITPIKGLFE